MNTFNYFLFSLLSAYIVFKSVFCSPCVFPKSKTRTEAQRKLFQALYEILDPVFEEVYNETAGQVPITVENCAILNEKEKCVQLTSVENTSLFNETKDCQNLTLTFIGIEGFKTETCKIPKAKECFLKCHIWFNEVNITRTYHTGQRFNFHIGLGYPIELNLETQKSKTSPILNITNFKFGDAKTDLGDRSSIGYSLTEKPHLLPIKPCEVDEYNTMMKSFFDEDMIKERIFRLFNEETN